MGNILVMSNEDGKGNRSNGPLVRRLTIINQKEARFCTRKLTVLKFNMERKASLVAQTVKRVPAMRESWLRFLGREDPLEKEMAIHSSTLAWKIPWAEKPDRLQSMGLQRVGHDWAISLSFTFVERKQEEKVSKSVKFWVWGAGKFIHLVTTELQCSCYVSGIVLGVFSVEQNKLEFCFMALTIYSGSQITDK